jgi:hypothetical protein
MANSEQKNVFFVDTTGATRAGPVVIKGIKYFGASSGTCTITDGTTGSGDPLWKTVGTPDLFDNVMIRAKDGFHVAVTNSAQVFIYLG